MALTAITNDVRIQNVIVKRNPDDGTFTLALEARVPLPFGFQRVTVGLPGLTATEAAAEATVNTLIGTINTRSDEILGL